MKIKELLEALQVAQEIVVWSAEDQDFVSFPLELGRNFLTFTLCLAAIPLDLEYEVPNIYFAAGTLRLGIAQ